MYLYIYKMYLVYLKWAKPRLRVQIFDAISLADRMTLWFHEGHSPRHKDLPGIKLNLKDVLAHLHKAVAEVSKIGRL